MTTGNKKPGNKFPFVLSAFFGGVPAFTAAERPKEVTDDDVDVLCKQNMGAGPNTKVLLTLEFNAAFC